MADLGWPHTFSAEKAQATFAQNAHIPIITIVLYLTLCAILPKLVRKPLQMKRIVAAWNLGLALFSIAGSAATLPTLIKTLALRGMWHSACAPCFTIAGTGIPSLFAMLFAWSKFAELVDTLILILRKKPLTTLHIFHHASVLGFTWLSWMYANPLALWYGTLNFLAHATMYTYYFLVTLDVTITRFASLITSVQVGTHALAPSFVAVVGLVSF